MANVAIRRASLAGIARSAVAVALALSWPVIAQEQQTQPPQAEASQSQAPRSLLPEGLAPPPPPPPGTAEGAAPIVPDEPFRPVPRLVIPVPTEPQKPSEPEEEAEKEDPFAALAGPVTPPEQAGLLSPATIGYSPDLFRASDARFVAALLERLDQPLASRWAQIMLQRALLTRADAPSGLDAADWVAARGAALIATGSAVDAHRMISRITIDRYTPRLYAVAAQAALASADPMALCPLSPNARAVSETPVWLLLDAMCLGIFGDDVGATALFDRVRRAKSVDVFDIGLAERVASATGGGQRGANPEWEGVDQLTAWRLGLATAAGLPLPDELYEQANPAQRGWAVRLAGLDVARRATFAPAAAAIGALGSAELTRLLAAEAGTLDVSAASKAPGGQLRIALLAVETDDRMSALKELWKRADSGSLDHYGWQIATATAAGRIPPSVNRAGDAAAIVASLNAAGLVEQAESWWSATAEASDEHRAALWGQLVAVSSQVPVDAGLFEDWASTANPHRASLLAAGLRGLGRGSVGPETPTVENEWTAALDRALANGRRGEVMVLVATGLQGQWADVHPDYLRRIAAALIRVGHPDEARMIVAEAANRG